MEPYKFWMIYNCSSGKLPAVRHESQMESEKEAERLARQNRGQVFIILEAMESFQATDLIRKKLEEGLGF